MSTTLTDGHVLHPDGSVSRADVRFEQSTGEIEAVGQGLAADRTLSAAGGLVMPGLVNAHTHAAMTLLRGYADDKPLDAWLSEDIWPAESALEPADVRAGTELALLEMIRSGTTAFADMYFHMDEVVAAVERAGLRARLAHGIVTVGKDEEAATADLQEGIDFARRADGEAKGRVQTAISPHSLTTVDESTLREAIQAARELGVPVHLHANETTEEVEPIVEERGVRPLAYGSELGLFDSQDFFAHGVHLDETELELLADRQPSVVHCPASNMKLASGMAPVEALLDAGVPLALGTDGAASNNDLDMFDEMRDAALLGKLAADDASAVPAEAVIEMATAGGARALDLPGGEVTPGAAADLIVVDFEAPRMTPVHDHVSHLVYAAQGSDVRHTVVDGEVLMRDREVQPLDERAVRETAQTRAARLAERA
ncbi:5-methylthioadenosine/S-adenosylhomocysteine deaminase [Halodesulfurarchaeum formicicum]|uniref:5-methylthioadenosine/S-adenosylhomocysteine deaminase n=1 Tax=Halodesulfurarchaeum formicicum TaxID=1873524 RepID=A0A1D8S1Y3_9EURY|nr:amidohydrolase [Halodesulfurarchaeum formicicum]AOW79368.1 5-methylthioadenosine/S-adenosylhomocysteine deaminase [Halodesulfurarchaeum formicicum]